MDWSSHIVFGDFDTYPSVKLMRELIQLHPELAHVELSSTWCGTRKSYPIHYAAYFSSKEGGEGMELLNELIALGVALDTPGYTSPLFTANVEGFEALVLAGADVNASDAYGVPILHRCVEWRSKRRIQLLMQHGVQHDLPDRNGDYAFQKLNGTKVTMEWDNILHFLKHGYPGRLSKRAMR